MDSRFRVILDPSNPTGTGLGQYTALNEDPPTAASEQGYGIDLPPHNFPPPDAYFFDQVAFAALPANGAANRLNVVSFQIPIGCTGVVRWLGNVYLGGSFVDGSGDVIWRIFVDDQPVQNYDTILASLGSLVSPSDTFIVVLEGQTIRMTVETALVPPAGGTTTGCRLKGWYWSQVRDVSLGG